MSRPSILPRRDAPAVLAMLVAIGPLACGTGNPSQTTGPAAVAVAAATATGDCANLVAQTGVAGDGPAGYTLCAAEGGSCTFTVPVDVAFGTRGGFAYKDGVTGTVAFTVASFGVDPIVHVAKAGYYRSSGGPPGYTRCADEGGTCSSSRTVDVAYGAHGLFNFRCGVTGSVAMTNAGFGDPADGEADLGRRHGAVGARTDLREPRADRHPLHARAQLAAGHAGGGRRSLPTGSRCGTRAALCRRDRYQRRRRGQPVHPVPCRPRDVAARRAVT